MSEAVLEQALEVQEVGGVPEEVPKIQLSEEHQSEMVNGETLSQVILAMLVDERFDSAVTELEYYQSEKNKIPNFKNRTKGYFDHSIAHIERLKELASVPNFKSLRTSKQKEIREQMSALAKDIKETLSRIEKVDYDLRVQDVRSTIWVLKTFSFCLLTLAFITALVEALQQLKSPFSTVTEQLIGIIFFSF